MAKCLIFSASLSFALCMDETFLLSDSTFISSCNNRDKHELEVDFKRFWEEFRSSNSEKLLSKLRVFRADETPLEVPPREVINFGDQAVVEFMADLVAKRDTKAAPPKNEKGFWFRICSICWPFRTANTDNKMCVCVFMPVPLLCKLFVRLVSFSAKFKILIACKCFQIQEK
ncbi:hypothetical protein ES332_D06G081700v1 [Gossypium tomentosum]|uniref:Uncharacterized protein n=1 Tax=Gossypium tomentosum TaxID=34277 RepID=A0A5D2KGE6_GOSTO|nr:hypothetical protein ES332_D06G081700v1 [Gossypium tomentosum]